MSHNTDDQSWLEARDNVEQVFKLIFGALVIFMQCGFSFLEAGAVRSKNTVNILMKNMNDCCEIIISPNICLSFLVGGALVFWSVGYAFAFGTDESNIIGTS